MQTTKRTRRQTGFTLIELLVALVIAMLVLGVFIAGTLESVRAARDTARTEEAIVRARSRLALAAGAPVVGDFQGEDGGGFHWRVSTRIAETYAPPGSQTVTTLYSIPVWISWRDGRRQHEFRLDGDRLFAAIPPQKS